MTDDEVRKAAEDCYRQMFPKDPTLFICDKCLAENCIYNRACVKCNLPILEVYYGIVKILQSNGFEQHLYGDLVRIKTGCLFSFECIITYKSVLDFQLDWGYA